MREMNSSVFVVDKNNALVELSRSDYQTEDLFQTLLPDHPALLRHASGDTGALLLVERERTVPDSQDGSPRWYLDHLFLDRAGVPVLVEVKRASDTRLRREVVAQMLDYAANGVAYWPIDEISEVFADEAGNEDAVARLGAFLDGQDRDGFWRQVESNLKSGRLRMVFVADVIPKELRRVVEFLNEQMRPAEVMAIEVQHFEGPNGLRVLTPLLIGVTERAVAIKSVERAKTPLSEEEWLDALRHEGGAESSETPRSS